MNVLLTGPTGFIGSHVAEELLKKGCRVTCLVRKTSDLTWIEGLDVSLHYGDVRDKASLVDAVSGVDYVFHLASLTRAPNEKEYFEVNVKGTEKLLEAVAETNSSLRKFVYLSSLAAVGPSKEGCPVNEDTVPQPVSNYGKSKLEAEMLVMGYSAKLPVTVIRAPAVYGPRDKDFYVLYRMLKRRVFPYWGKSYYSLLYVEDLVRGLITAAESDEAAGRLYFLSDDGCYSNLDIARVISEALGSSPVKVPLPKGVMPIIANFTTFFAKNSSIINTDKIKEFKYTSWVCDPAKANRELGFTPQVSMSMGFRWTANWYRIHQWL